MILTSAKKRQLPEGCRMWFGWRKVPHLEKKYVQESYDIIAEHFSHSRFAIWPKVRHFLSTLEENSIVFDVGCGNGKYFSLSNNFLLGSDTSLKLLQQAQRSKPTASLIVSDAVNIPLRADSCDAFIFSWERRQRAVSEMARILRKGGRGLIYVWCSEQQLKNRQPIDGAIVQGQQDQLRVQLSREQDIFVKWHLQDIYSQHLSQQFQKIPSKKASIVKRYYHLFKQGELQSLIRAVPSLRIVHSMLDKDNWCCQVMKT